MQHHLGDCLNAEHKWGTESGTRELNMYTCKMLIKCMGHRRSIEKTTATFKRAAADRASRTAVLSDRCPCATDTAPPRKAGCCQRSDLPVRVACHARQRQTATRARTFLSPCPGGKVQSRVGLCCSRRRHPCEDSFCQVQSMHRG